MVGIYLATKSRVVVAEAAEIQQCLYHRLVQGGLGLLKRVEMSVYIPPVASLRHQLHCGKLR
jgi:hypothetical protein